MIWSISEISHVDFNILTLVEGLNNRLSERLRDSALIVNGPQCQHFFDNCTKISFNMYDIPQTYYC